MRASRLPHLTLAAASLAALAALAACDDATSPEPDATPGAASIGSLVTPAAPAGLSSGPSLATCPYDEATGWHSCPPTTQNGVTVTTMVRYLDARGAPQRAMDARTVAQLVRATLRGTLTTGADRLTIDRTSQDSLSGFAAGALVQNGTAAGAESGTVTLPDGAYDVVRTYVDTTRAVTTVIDTTALPRTPGAPPVRLWPSSGTVTQVGRTTYAPKGAGTPRVVASRTVTEWIGGGRARITTTLDGRTSSCTVDYSALALAVGSTVPCVP